MTMVVGVICDSCGGSDLGAFSRDLNEDNFPRNGWMSINVHDDGGDPDGSEIHICSVPCLEKLAKTLMKNAPAEHENHSHDHPHTH